MGNLEDRMTKAFSMWSLHLALPGRSSSGGVSWAMGIPDLMGSHLELLRLSHPVMATACYNKGAMNWVSQPHDSLCFKNANHFFPTCQVRVVRFYQSACPPPLPPPPPPPRLAVLLALLLASASSTSTSALPTLPTRRQALRQLPSSVRTAGPQLDLNLRAAQLSVHRWTSTGDLPSSVCTAGPQPGTCPAQCAPLDLNLGPAQLSVHRWTSTAR